MPWRDMYVDVDVLPLLLYCGDIFLGVARWAGLLQVPHSLHPGFSQATIRDKPYRSLTPPPLPLGGAARSACHQRNGNSFCNGGAAPKPLPSGGVRHVAGGWALRSAIAPLFSQPP